MSGLIVLDSHKHFDRDRMYYLVDTPLGRVIYYTMGANNHETASYKNLTNGDIFWQTKDMRDFLTIFGGRPIEIFVSKRLKGFPRKKLSVDGGGSRYWLAEKSKSDGWLYEIPATELRAFPATRFPDKEFVYTRYNIEAMRTMSHADIDRLKTEAVWRFNGDNSHSKHAVSAIVDAVYDYVNKDEGKAIL